MSTTKIAIAIAAIAAITLAVLGVAAASLISQNQTYLNTQTTQNNVAPNQGFWGWIGDCFGFGGTPYYANQAPAPANITVTNPYTGTTTTYQSYYGYGYGGCMGGFFP